MEYSSATPTTTCVLLRGLSGRLACVGDLYARFSHSCAMCKFTFFFFQAEDGIRDLIVTGVQTCALPILGHEVRDHRLHDLADRGETDVREQVEKRRLGWPEAAPVVERRGRLRGVLAVPADRKSVV